MDLGFEDAALPNFRVGRAQDKFGEIEEALERVATIIAWAGTRADRIVYVQWWIDSWSPNCEAFMIGITHDEWFYLFEPHRMWRQACNEDRFAARHRELWQIRTAQLRLLVAFFLTCPSLAPRIECVDRWLQAGRYVDRPRALMLGCS